MLLFTQHAILTKDPKYALTNNTFIADSGETCHMRGSLEGMSNLKFFVNDIWVGKSGIIVGFSKG
jgi:hypothetical protein